MDKRIKLAAGVGAAVAILAGVGYCFFHTDTDTPDFAIKSVEKSIEKHDVKAFHRAVNLDSVLDSGYDGFVDGLTNFDSAMVPETRDAIRNFTQMLRAPLLLSLKAAVDSYVATGDLNTQENIGVADLIQRTGLNDIEVHGVKNIERNDANENEAFADVIVFQPELGSEFPIRVVLARQEDKSWQIVRVQNFQDFVAQVAQVRKAQIGDYLAKVAEINMRHELAIREAEQKFGTILSLGSLGQDNTRSELKNLMTDVYKKDWETRKQEFFSLHVPKDAETLHNLYMKICDLCIDYADDYSKWLDDKNALTIKSAETKLHQAQTLMTEAAQLAKRMSL